jgi:hypothetical protein
MMPYAMESSLLCSAGVLCEVPVWIEDNVAATDIAAEVDPTLPRQKRKVLLRVRYAYVYTEHCLLKKYFIYLFGSLIIYIYIYILLYVRVYIYRRRAFDIALMQDRGAGKSTLNLLGMASHLPCELCMTPSINVEGNPRGLCSGRGSLIAAGLDGDTSRNNPSLPNLGNKTPDLVGTMLGNWIAANPNDKKPILHASGFNVNGPSPLWIHPLTLFGDYYLPPDLMHACRNLCKYLVFPCLDVGEGARDFRFKPRVSRMISMRIEMCCVPHDCDALPDFVKYHGSIYAAAQKDILIQFAPALFLHDFDVSEEDDATDHRLYYLALSAMAWSLDTLLNHGKVSREKLQKVCQYYITLQCCVN